MADSTGLLKHAMRYLIGGATTTILCWGCVFVFVEYLRFHYLISTNLATFIAYFYSYGVNKIFVFGDKKRGHVIKGSKFLMLQLCMLLFANAFMFSTVTLLGIHYMIAVVAVSIITAISSFVFMRMAIFDIDQN